MKTERNLVAALKARDFIIGLHKQGKTDFYRDFLHHLKHSEDRLVFAPRIKGMVMAVFTLPLIDQLADYPLVLIPFGIFDFNVFTGNKAG